MSTYKVIQDIEAEDKLLGPLSLRQFIYAAIVAVLGFISYKLAAVNILMALPLLLPMAFFGLLAAPFGHDQSSEVWLLAKIRFMLKPRQRIWDQDGIQELVTITAPKKMERHLTNGLSQTEVKSRLQALATTLDSRGWVIKNISVNMFSEPSYLMQTEVDSDRLIDLSSLPQEVPNYEVAPSDDILDAATNPTAQNLDAMIQQSAQSHRQAAMQQAQPQQPQSPAQTQTDGWFTGQPATQTAMPQRTPGSVTGQSNTAAIAQNTQTPEEQQLLQKLHDGQNKPDPTYGHLKAVQPIGGKQPTPATPNPTSSAAPDSTDPKEVDPNILRLATNDDLNVATIQREANRSRELPDDEVVISLH